MHKKNIEHIIEYGTPSQMHAMKEVLVELIDYLKYSDHDKYLCAEYELATAAYDGHISEELAKHWVKCMENKDGTTGEHWTKEQIATVAKEKGLTCNVNDLYVAMNMVYSDFYNSKFDTNIYLDMAKDWLHDKDVGDNKLLKYYYFVVK